MVRRGGRQMIIYEDIEISPELIEILEDYHNQVEKFREQGPLDKVSMAKLEEHFKASHIYHSTGIEGNRLTLQETIFVLTEGIEVRGKPIKESIEVKQLGKAYDFLKELADRDQTIRESDIRSLHELIVGDNKEVSPGSYRKIGVIISGSEHKPTDPLSVPAMMEELVDWINFNIEKNPIIVSTIAHHELTYIHPFKDGNGRISRLLMNLILLKRGYPICNIAREDRPDYFESLSFADIKLYEPLIKMIYKGSHALFSEYKRIQDETTRALEWAEKWGQTEAAVIQKREARELELWQTKMRQIYLEFDRAADLLDQKIQNFAIDTYDYDWNIDLNKFHQLQTKGNAEYTNFFAISFFEKPTEKRIRFMFRFYRNYAKFPNDSKTIPLELNYFDPDEKRYIRISELSWNKKLRIRELYFSEDGKLHVICYDQGSDNEVHTQNIDISNAVKMFYDDVLRNIFLLTP